MALLNPDPRATGYVFIPANRVTGVFSESQDAQEALPALAAAGWEGEPVVIFCNVEGAEKLDLQGLHHGPAFHHDTEYRGVRG